MRRALQSSLPSSSTSLNTDYLATSHHVSEDLRPIDALSNISQLPSSSVLQTLSPDAQACIERLRRHESVSSEYALANLLPRLSSSLGQVKQAAVLVALFQPPNELDLRIVLTTRASTLRSVFINSGMQPICGSSADITQIKQHVHFTV